MPARRPVFPLAFVCVGALAVLTGPVTAQLLPAPSDAATYSTVAAPDSNAFQLPGREQDARVARLAFRLAVAGRARCPALQPNPGLVLQHLTQFQLADRPGMIAALALDRGPGVIVVVPGGPAAIAGIRAGDILLAINGAALPPEPGLSAPFEAARAHARNDAITDLLAAPAPVSAPAPAPVDVTLLRDGRSETVRLAPLPACPSRVHLARSGQRNAYADGQHVFLTTGLLALLHNDDELAFVMAHEMAHTILGHAAIMRGGGVRKGIGRTLGHSGELVRATESAADALGTELMLDAGMDPVRGAAILTRLGGGDLGISLLASHEPAGKRVAAIRALVQARVAR